MTYQAKTKKNPQNLSKDEGGEEMTRPKFSKKAFKR